MALWLGVPVFPHQLPLIAPTSRSERIQQEPNTYASLAVPTDTLRIAEKRVRNAWIGSI